MISGNFHIVFVHMSAAKEVVGFGDFEICYCRLSVDLRWGIPVGQDWNSEDKTKRSLTNLPEENRKSRRRARMCVNFVEVVVGIRSGEFVRGQLGTMFCHCLGTITEKAAKSIDNHISQSCNSITA